MLENTMLCLAALLTTAGLAAMLRDLVRLGRSRRRAASGRRAAAQRFGAALRRYLLALADAHGEAVPAAALDVALGKAGYWLERAAAEQHAGLPEFSQEMALLQLAHARLAERLRQAPAGASGAARAGRALLRQRHREALGRLVGRCERIVTGATPAPAKRPAPPPGESPDPRDDPGTNRTHPQPDPDADRRRDGGTRHSEKSPYAPGQQ